ncbi:hypothetical protein AAC387_Pa01g3532 [Persea americana]
MPAPATSEKIGSVKETDRRKERAFPALVYIRYARMLSARNPKTSYRELKWKKAGDDDTTTRLSISSPTPIKYFDGLSFHAHEGHQSTPFSSTNLNRLFLVTCDLTNADGYDLLLVW